MPLAGGAGCEFWDHEGNRWLDFSSQLVNLNLGHQHPKIIAAIVEQASGSAPWRPPSPTRPATRPPS